MRTPTFIKKYQRQEAKRKKSETTPKSGGPDHQFIQGHGPHNVGGWVGKCSCGWESDVPTEIRIHSEQDWERHHQYMEDMRRAFVRDEAARKKAEWENWQYRMKFEEIRRRYLKEDNGM